MGSLGTSCFYCRRILSLNRRLDMHTKFIHFGGNENENVKLSLGVLLIYIKGGEEI